MSNIITVCILCAIVIIMVYLCVRNKEGFATLENKASAYKAWMMENPRATYNEFREIHPNANIVEYNKMRKIYQEPIAQVANSLRIQ